MAISPPAKIALLGYGRFGRAFASLLLDAGVRVRAFDPKADIPPALREDTLEALAGSAEILIAAVPVECIPAALRELRPFLTPRHLIVDVASVKHGPVKAMTEILGADISWTATHPLFGPMSIARGERPLKVVVCPNPLHREAAARARALYESLGCTVIEEEVDQHDRIMADTHALAFFVAKGMLESGVSAEVTFAPPSFQAMAQTIDAVRSDAGHLFYPIAHGNPHAAAARERLLAALDRIHREIAQTPEAPETAPAKFIIATPKGPAPELRKARDLIDELDEQLVALLARRVQLAYHAARVKAETGRPVQDPQRETLLLTQRTQWAEKFRLMPQGVRIVFESILEFSRAEQRRWLDERKTRA